MWSRGVDGDRRRYSGPSLPLKHDRARAISLPALTEPKLTEFRAFEDLTGVEYVVEAAALMDLDLPAFRLPVLLDDPLHFHRCQQRQRNVTLVAGVSEVDAEIPAELFVRLTVLRSVSEDLVNGGFQIPDGALRNMVGVDYRRFPRSKSINIEMGLATV